MTSQSRIHQMPSPYLQKLRYKKNPPKPELDRWDIADGETTRFQPTAFSELPEHIVAELQSRQCTIPQIYDDPEPHNVISGEFKEKGQTDWAVLCSKDLISSILIFLERLSAKPLNSVFTARQRSFARHWR